MACAVPLHQQKNFTAFQFADISQMTGLNALKLYPLFCSFKSMGSWEVGFSELKCLLGQCEAYSAYKVFYKRVLAPAIKEINERTGHQRGLRVHSKQGGQEKGRQYPLHDYREAELQEIRSASREDSPRPRW